MDTTDDAMNPDPSNALAALPHGSEFRFVDRLESLTPGHAAVGVYQLPTDAAFLAGHFPEAPIMPGVLMIEALAQVAGIAAQTDPGKPALEDLRLTAIRQIKILGTILPGQSLWIHAEISGRLGNLIQAAGRVTDEEGTLLVEGQVTLSGTLADSKP
jgi:3-hydroxyacyl-[acyl-carrier-protein] dehydratase